MRFYFFYSTVHHWAVTLSFPLQQLARNQQHTISFRQFAYSTTRRLVIYCLTAAIVKSSPSFRESDDCPTQTCSCLSGRYVLAERCRSPRVVLLFASDDPIAMQESAASGICVNLPISNIIILIIATTQQVDGKQQSFVCCV